MKLDKFHSFYWLRCKSIWYYFKIPMIR